MQLATEADTALLVGNVGRCDPEDGAIYVDRTMDRAAVDQVVFHELLHAAFPAGVVRLRTEEAIVDTLEQRLWPFLRGRGLSWPRRRV